MFIEPTPQSRGRLKEVLASIFFGAPDDFFQPSNARPGEEVTMDGTIDQMRRGILYVFSAPRHQEAAARMLVVLDEIDGKFRSGDVSSGRIQCHELRDMISKAPR